MRRLLAFPAALAAVGAATTAYAVREATSYRLRRFDVPVLDAGEEPLRILHISDLHVVPGQVEKARFVRALAMLEPDLVVDTGDNLAHHDAVPHALAMLEPLLELPGVFVTSSNDYHAPKPKNPLRYLLPDDGRRIHGERLPWRDLRNGLQEAGWHDVTNAATLLEVGDRRVWVGGVGDRHIHADRYDTIAGPVRQDVVLALGLSHTPEPSLLERFAADGYRLVLSGHTHGGQLRIPGYGAIVTNCGLERQRARWLSMQGRMWLHVSAGLGTSPYTPFRLACPPEATLLTLVPGGAIG